MFKWILFLSVLSVIDAQMVPGQCVVPRLANGRLRWRSRSKLIRFSCNYGFELVGSRYATCRNAQWDTPKPTCVKPGCPVPQLTNGLVITSRSDAFLVFFCLPGFKLVGTTAMYCDGKSWNTTMPSCVDSAMVSKTSCDFEDPDLCGWIQDSLHDFDWERLNRKTPSSFMNTGPSFDHTIGKGGAGYYMYIESSSRLENETARLISPIYDMEIAKDGCFSFYYHMFGRYLGGLRVYQKPDNIPLQTMLKLPEETRKKYVLFEQWGDQGDFWYRGVSQLHDFNDNFQIVMEGIRGKRFTSDIAIDDVAILQGENCTIAKRNMVTPPPAMLPSTCEGRCGSGNLALIGCSCAYTCLVSYNCCPDYFEVCLDMIDDDDDLTLFPAKSSAWRGVLITLAVLVCGAGLAWLAAGARGARGRAALATLRGRATHDPEVRYLHSDNDDE
ncbi:MAM and LDL-receptor class A domain-containing protein 1-like [Ostrinia furnacalis]|uniref:MAM and LDL-receptor class A domain-containing protein 1-like n=1 Tax=Ostrinia furnacalis TaxID=93504 RepID=UPI00103C4559|nr:MAM and LDL-receptor class A domain-containing protein 1-like [Ostrinia furnacalis]